VKAIGADESRSRHEHPEAAEAGAASASAGSRYRHYGRVLVWIICLPGCGRGDITGATADGRVGQSASECSSSPTLVVGTDALIPRDAGGAVTVWFAAHGGAVFYEALAFTTDGQQGVIMRLPATGATPVVITSFAGDPDGLSVISTGLAFGIGPNARFGGDAQNVGQIATIPFDGGSETLLTPTNGAPSGAPVSDGQNLYYIDGDGVESVPLTGGSPRLITNQQGMSLALWDGNIIIDDFADNQILSVPSDGGAVTVLAADQVGPQLIQNCDSDVCWVNIGTPIGTLGPSVPGSLMRLGINGNPVTVAALSDPHGLAYDGEAFFVTEANSLLKIPSEGGSAVVLANMSALGNVIVDNSCVYWLSLDGIYSISKGATGRDS
jgi:hypothetical protein